MIPTLTAPAATDLTFILPTRNRREVVTRALDSCLQVARPGINVEVLVIDGNSTDGSWEMLQQRHAGDAHVRLLRQQGATGFMPACFFALENVRTEFCTFMYDDDVLSPHWWQLVPARAKTGAGFAMGFGKVNDIHSVMAFQDPGQILAGSGHGLLKSYSHVGYAFPPHGLPYSPISCFTRTSTLHTWANEVRDWASGRPLREHWMMKRNAGPDLMIYLLSILLEQGEIPVVDAVLGQWSTHEGSMTLQFESNDIFLGYWLAKAWLCSALQKRGEFRLAGACAAGIYRDGVRLLELRRAQGRAEWEPELAAELSELRSRMMEPRTRVSFLWTRLAHRLPRRLRRKIIVQEPLRALPN